MNTERRGLLAAALLATTLLFACDSGDDESSSPAVAGLGKVTGTVQYTGGATGPLKLAIYATFPPAGPPLASARYSAPSFPLAYEILSPEGEYKVLAFLDVGNDSLVPGREDVLFSPADVVVKSGGQATADLVEYKPR